MQHRLFFLNRPLCATMFDYKLRFQRNIATNKRYELSQVRLPLALVASLIKLQIGSLENVGLFAVCSPQYFPMESSDVYSPALLPFL